MIRPAFPPVERSVLVTGCSSGIGLATAKVLRARGWRVFPTARTLDDLEMLRELGFQPVKLDVCDAGSVADAVEDVMTLSNESLGALVNNAGVAQYGAVEDLTREALRRQFEVNLFGAHDLTSRLIPHFRQQGAGRIVNVSSVFGRVAAPMVGCYCASKYAMEALSDAMRVELRPEAIAVSLIEPGPIFSAFRTKSAEHSITGMDMRNGRFQARYARRMEKAKAPQRHDFFTKPPEAVAARIVHALESRRPKSRYGVTLPAYAAAVLRRLAPDTVLDALLARSARV